MTENDNDPEKKQTDDSETTEPDAAPAKPTETPDAVAPEAAPDASEASAAPEAEPEAPKDKSAAELSADAEAAAEPEQASKPAEPSEQAEPAQSTAEPQSDADAANPAPGESAPEPQADTAPETPTEAEPEPAPETAAAPEPPAEGEGDEPAAESEPPADTSEPAAEPEPAAAPEPEPEPEPLRVYEYRYIRVRQNAWDEAEQAILGKGAAAVAEAGGQFYGLWAGQIGLSANQGVVVTVWTSLDAAKQGGKTAIAAADSIAASETLYLEPTARPEEPTAPEGPGMFAHRVFEVRRDDADRFIALSSEAWPQFEEVFGARIFALWRETGHDRAMDRLILLTRYPDYAAWEASRFWRPDPDPKAADALARFRERREITTDTVVYTARLASPAAG